MQTNLIPYILIRTLINHTHMNRFLQRWRIWRKSALIPRAKERKNAQRIIVVALVVLAALLAVAVVFFVHEYRTLQRANLINLRRTSLSGFVKKHGPLNAEEVGLIQPWMTFHYINSIFNLPTDFLKNSFAITDPHYPDLTLDRYIDTQGFDPLEFTRSLQAAISSYLSEGSQSSTSTSTTTTTTTSP